MIDGSFHTTHTFITILKEISGRKITKNQNQDQDQDLTEVTVKGTTI